MNDARASVLAKAHALGFDLVGIADASEPLKEEYQRYLAFVSAGMHASMDYLAASPHARERVNTDAVLEGARSIICLAESYAGKVNDGGAGADGGEGVVPAIARYARGGDYHNHLRRKLRKLAAYCRTLAPGAFARPITDNAPILERAWAARAGLGFTGKNGLIIAPGRGSYLLLGEVVTTLELSPDQPIADRCGSCTACLDACPTQAFDAPYVLNPARCISYLTIEHRAAIPETSRAAIGEHLFGCDICQQVCPFNAAPSTRREVPARYRPLPRWQQTTLEQLAEIGDADWDSLKEGSALRRIGKGGLSRNAVTILANREDPRYRPLFERLAAGHPDVDVREHAAWGLDRLAKPDDIPQEVSPPWPEESPSPGSQWHSD